MTVTIFVDVYEMTPETKHELSQIAKIKSELPLLKTYVMEYIPQGRTIDEINQTYENFIRKLKSYEFVKTVDRVKIVSPCCD